MIGEFRTDGVEMAINSEIRGNLRLHWEEYNACRRYFPHEPRKGPRALRKDAFYGACRGQGRTVVNDDWGIPYRWGGNGDAFGD